MIAAAKLFTACDDGNEYPGPQSISSRANPASWHGLGTGDVRGVTPVVPQREGLVFLRAASWISLRGPLDRC